MTKIEWTDKTWNPIRTYSRDRRGWHCERVSDGCRNCYAEAMNKWRGTGLDFKPGNKSQITIYLDDKKLADPLKWRQPRMVFVCSMTDIFADFVKDEWLDRIFATMAIAPKHTFQVLTKRPERMRQYINSLRTSGRWLTWGHPTDVEIDRIFDMTYATWDLMFPHVWLGTSVEDQATADERIPQLLNTDAATRFISAEPLLGPVNLTDIERLDWVIAGGESGNFARPANPDWFRSLRDQCAAAAVPFHFKQFGEFTPNREDATGETPSATFTDGGRATEVFRVGKQAAGRTLDGATHDGFPVTRAAAE